MTKIRYLDTFAGVGGFHLALEQSIGKENIECIGYSEIDKFAKQVYSERFPGSKDLGNIIDLDIDSLEDFDLLTGGFPCQDVSVAGKQSLEGGRTVLVEYLLQILEQKQPKYFVFENVKGLMSKKFDTFRESIFDRIKNAGYDLSYQVLNTKDFGLPQNRERIFMVGQLKPTHTFLFFPEGQELTTFLKDILEEEVDEKYYLSDEQFESLKKYESNSRLYDKVCCTLNTMQGGHRQPKIKISYCLDANYAKGTTASNYIEKSRRQLVGKQDRIRKLTPTECSRLQGFPDTWSTDFVSNSQAYKQMGNAISVPVVKAIFDNLL